MIPGRFRKIARSTLEKSMLNCSIFRILSTAALMQLLASSVRIIMMCATYLYKAFTGFSYYSIIAGIYEESIKYTTDLFSEAREVEYITYHRGQGIYFTLSIGSSDELNDQPANNCWMIFILLDWHDDDHLVPTIHIFSNPRQNIYQTNVTRSIIHRP